MYYLRKKKSTDKKKSTTASLVAKLDRVFSRYIRLRDAMPSGFCRCISCGQIKSIKQMDCGHYFSRRSMATRFNEDNCNAECSYCLTPDALILTADFKWRPLGALSIGDAIFGFEETLEHRTCRRYAKSIVTHTHRELQDVYAVELENGDIVKTTAEHMWLARGRQGTAYQWIKTKDLWINGANMCGKHKTGPHSDRVTSVVCKPFMVTQQDMSYESGWIAGMIDADGHITQQNIHNPDGSIRYGFRVGVAQCEKYPTICKQIIETLEKFTNNNKHCRQWIEKTVDDKRGIKSKYQTWQFLITGTNVEKLQFLMKTRPHKISKVEIAKLGKLKSQYDTKVKSIAPLGQMEVVVLETSTHTFIADGYAMHNCNRFSADHLHGYRENLIKKIGEQRFALLEVKHNETRKWSVWELEQLITYYTKLASEISKEKGITL